MKPALNKDVQRYAMNNKENNKRNYDCKACIVWSLTSPTRNHYAFGKIKTTAMHFSIRNKQFRQILLHIHS